VIGFSRHGSGGEVGLSEILGFCLQPPLVVRLGEQLPETEILSEESMLIFLLTYNLQGGANWAVGQFRSFLF